MFKVDIHVDMKKDIECRIIYIDLDLKDYIYIYIFCNYTELYNTNI